MKPVLLIGAAAVAFYVWRKKRASVKLATPSPSLMPYSSAVPAAQSHAPVTVAPYTGPAAHNNLAARVRARQA